MTYHLEETIPAEKGDLLETPKVNVYDGICTITNDYGTFGSYDLHLEGLGSYHIKEHANRFDINIGKITYILQKQ